MPQVVDPAHLTAAQTVRAALARLEESREARELGVVAAEPAEPALEAFLRQGSQQELIARTLSALHHLADRI
jgi:flagellar biosynthesis/type III secretory pathway ATPase